MDIDKRMKKMKNILIVLIICAMSLLCEAQDNNKNSISLGFGSVVSTKMESFSPVIDLTYRKDLTDKLGLNIGYKFKDCNYDKVCVQRTIDVYGNLHFYTDSPNLLTHSAIIGLAYKLRLSENIYLVPILDLGLGFSKMTRTWTYSKNGHTGIGSLGRGLTSSINPSINIEYNFKKFKILCSYTYEMLFVIGEFYKPNLMVHWLDIFTTDYYFLGDFKLGVAYKF